MAAIFSNIAAIFKYVPLRNLVLMSHRTTKFCNFVIFATLHKIKDGIIETCIKLTSVGTKQY